MKKDWDTFLNINNLVNLVKANTCSSSSCSDLTLTNKKYSFQNTIFLETGLRGLVIIPHDSDYA